MTKNTNEFYDECIKEYHLIAQKYNYAKRGLIFIPELLEYAKKYELRMLNDQHYISTYSSNAVNYYYVIFQLSLKTGMIAGKQWHNDFSNFEKVMEDSYYNGVDYIGEVYKDLNTNAQDFSVVVDETYDKLLELHNPYWELKDPREYTFNAILAGFQLGVSIILEKYGY